MAAYYTFEDLSGSKDPVNADNPYQGLIDACSNDMVISFPRPRREVSDR